MVSGGEGIDAIALGCANCDCNFRPMRFKRRPLGDYDIHVEMHYCGVCHSDVHFAKNELGNTVYPIVPGHELAGKCVAIGPKVTKFDIGDHVGIGCFVDSCLNCKRCKDGEEQYCEKGFTATFGSENTHGRAAQGPGWEQCSTFGGYTNNMVVHERFAIKIRKDYPLEMAGSLMCAAITMYDPLKHFGAKQGTRVAILGLGGLGMMGVKLAKAMGCHVTVISRTAAKSAYAAKLGADAYVAAADASQMKAAAKSLDLILDTISANHSVNPYLPLLDVDGCIVVLGLCTEPHSVSQLPLIFGRTGIYGSVIGGIKNTQEVVDLCAEQQIYPEVKVVPVKEVNRVFETLNASNDAGIRYVLDIKGTLTEKAFTECVDAEKPDFSKGEAPATAEELLATLKVYAQQIAFFAFGLSVGMLIMHGYFNRRVIGQ